MSETNLPPSINQKRQDFVFLILASFFIGTLAMMNILGVSRFVDLSFTLGSLKIPMVIAVGVLPYPITFLCTDLISELFGRKKANNVVWCGLLVNLWLLFILWLGGFLPDSSGYSTWTSLPKDSAGRLPLYFEVQQLTFGATFASMIAYLCAQFCDVELFHFWKRLTKGKHLWLRNNFSTIISQLIDTISVILITHFYAHALPINSSEELWPQLFTLIGSAYVFKFVVALLDTIPIYILVALAKKYLHLDSKTTH